MKKNNLSALLFSLISILILLATGCAAQTATTTTPLATQTAPTPTPTAKPPSTPTAGSYSTGGVSFNYPTSWATSNPSSANAIVTVKDPQNSTTSVAIEKQQMPSGYTLKKTFDDLVASMGPEKVISAAASSSVGGLAAYESTFTSMGSQIRFIGLVGNINYCF